MKKLFTTVLLAVTTLIASGVAFAQVTTASLGGQITDQKGETVVGAAVIATHTPSGTTYGAVTNADGRYSINGMRAGGPYVIEVSCLGYQTVKFTEISLTLGETYQLDGYLNEDVQALMEAVVVARGDAGKTGAAQRINRSTIEEMPSITRGIADVTRINPFVRTNSDGAMTFAGTNNRYNSFQIDGAMNNDVFGLTASGSNGGQAGAQPVSMETIEQVQVSIAPFDVRQSGFTGGAINAITKSGTNLFHGSAYGYFLNHQFIGKYRMANGSLSGDSDQMEMQAGATVSGPIVKNKLFFFASFETTNKEYPNVYGAGSALSKVDTDKAREVLNWVKAHSDYTGELPGNQANYTKSNKATVKLDWNINEKHHASFRWSLVDAKQLNSTSNASNMNATDYSYDFLSNTNSFVAELQSNLTSSLSNEFRVSYVRVRDKRNPLGANFPMIQVSNVGGGTLNLGNERSSVANRLDQDIISVTDNFSWLVGNHNVTFGTHNEFYRFTNLFIQDKYGSFYFDSPEDLYAGVLKQYRYAHANVDVTGDENWEPTFWAGQVGLYAQDKWNITRDFELTYGVRVDVPLFFSIPTENVPFTAYAQGKDWNVRTNQMPKALPLVSPRIGFRYNIAGDSRFVMRGGVGLFTGRIPFVWFSNNFSNTGVQLTAINLNKANSAAAGVQVILDPARQGENEALINAAGGAAAGSQTINVMDPNFKVAQNLRADLAFDLNLLGINWTIEGIFSKNINDVAYTQMAYEATGETLGQKFPALSYDNRPMFSRATNGTDFANIYQLTNTNKGYSYNIMLQAAKSFPFGLDLNASYTFSQSKSVFNGTSSVAQSNFAYNYTHTNPNDPELGNSAFNIPHQVKASVYYHTTYGRSDRWTTTVGAVFVGTSGAAYSLYYNGDLNGDSSNGNDLMFIPTDEQIDQMQFQANGAYTAEVQAANLKAWLGSAQYLKDHRGQYYDRYADNLPFEGHIDLHLGQKVNLPYGKHTHTLELTADIINFTNLINPEWGRSYGMGINSYYNPVSYRGNGQFQFLQPADFQLFTYSDYLSRWKCQIGLKYTF